MVCIHFTKVKFCLFLLLREGLTPTVLAGVLWHKHDSLQPRLPRPKLHDSWEEKEKVYIMNNTAKGQCTASASQQSSLMMKTKWERQAHLSPSLSTRGLTLSPRLKCSGAIIAHCSIELLDSESHYVSQAGLELPATGDPPTLASQYAGIMGSRSSLERVPEKIGEELEMENKSLFGRLRLSKAAEQ
ncbi:hypothetical protein AAY473_017243 [Plecturocebus cupreus]